MRRFTILFLMLTAAARLCGDETATLAAVRLADDARVAAMIAADPAKLDAVLSDRLHYAHSAKLIENKAEYIESLASRRLIYRRVDFKTRDFVVISPGVVSVTGRALVEVGSARMIFLVDVHFLGVWRLEDQRWRLFAWQSSRNEEIEPLGPYSEKELNHSTTAQRASRAADR